MTNLSRIQDSQLLDFIESGPSRGKVSVIVEGPTEALKFVRGGETRTDRRGRLPDPARQIVGSHRLSRIHSSRPLNANSSDDLRKALERLGVRMGVENALTGAVVVDVTKSQLLKLAEDPSVGSVRANRFHRR